MKRFFITLFLFFFSLHQPAETLAQLPANFEQWVEDGRQQWQIPGMAIAIVKDDEIVFARGFGVKKLGENDPVDENTLFGIASVSKNITAAALSILVDEGKLSWDDRIVDIIPWFELSDPWVTKHVTVRDVLTHQVGVGRMLGNRLQFMTSSPRDQIIFQMRYADFEQPFRSSYVYSNVMYSVAGQLIEYIEGVSWDEFLMERLFKPLGMSSKTSITMLNDEMNTAWPHQEFDGEVKTIPMRNWDNAGPAGGVIASVSDIAQWLRLQLGEPGVHNGNRIISTQQMYEMHRPQVSQRIGNPYGPQSSYGLGFSITDYEGHRRLSHGGATDGMNTTMTMIPELNLGVIVVTNTFNNYMGAVANTILDYYLGLDYREWNERAWSGYQNTYNRVSQNRKVIHDARVSGTSTTLPIDSYTGTYDDKLYGKTEIRLEDGKLIVRFWDDEDLEAEFEHWHYDTFRAIWKNPAQREEFVHFTLGRDARVESMNVQFALRQQLMQVGAYPTSYYRVVRYMKND